MYQQSTMSPALLTKALLRAVGQLDLAAELPALLQTSREEATRLESGARQLDPQKREWDAALKIVGLFRTVIELLGTAERAKAWLVSHNDTLGGRPIDLLTTPDAELVHRYLSSVRKHELRMPPASRRDH
ncbi:MAG: MbcA/ParS/Xre antitoxin family protein [Steroidobacter sp.]